MDITAESGTGEVEVDPQPVHVKRLYMSGCEFAGRADGFSAGLAISIFQDAVEDLLRYLVGRLDGKISKVPNFAELMNAVEKIRATMEMLENWGIAPELKILTEPEFRLSTMGFVQQPPKH